MSLNVTKVRPSGRTPIPTVTAIITARKRSLGQGGCAWLLGGACVVALGGACVVALGGGHAWLLLGGGAWLLRGACVVAPGEGVHGCSGGRGACVVAPGGGGHTWDMTRYGDTINERAVRILLECIFVSLIFTTHSLRDTGI